MPRLGASIFVISLKLFTAWFAMSILSKFTTLADAPSYVAGAWTSATWTERTFFVGNLAFFIAQNLGVEWTYYIFSFISSIGILLVLYSVEKKMLPWITTLLLLPSATIFTSIPGKECLAGFGGCLILAWWLKFLKSPKTWSTITLLPVGLLLLTFIRPHYSLAAFYLVIMTILWEPMFRVSLSPIKFYTLSRLSSGIILTGLSLGVAFFWPKIAGGMTSIVSLALQYFPAGDGRSDRHSWLNWRQQTDFWDNSYWALPFSIIGPLPQEALARPAFIPFFIEGFFILSLVIFSLIKSLLAKNSQKRKFALCVLGPTIMILIVVHAPFGTANPGSALRYRSALEWLLIIPAAVTVSNQMVFFRRSSANTKL